MEGSGLDNYGALGGCNYAVASLVSGFNTSAVAPLPTVSITAPANNSAGTVGTPVNFTASASETGGTIASVSYYINSNLIGTSTTGSTFSVSWTPATWGNYTFQAIATDTTGHTSYRSSPITVQVPAP